jgi:hypothetical protein
MKWFQHECTAMSEPKLRRLGEKCGAEGFGIYWGLMEKIGLHSSSFHLKVSGISEDSDKKFRNEMLAQKRKRKALEELDLMGVPELSVQLLASDFFTTIDTLSKVLDQAAQIGLFDLFKWQKYHLLYSGVFEHRADEYTRKLMRKEEQSRPNSRQNPDNVGTESGHTPDNVRPKHLQNTGQPPDTLPTMLGDTPDTVGTKSKKVRLQQHTQAQEQSDKKDIHACTPNEKPDNTSYQQPADEDFIIDPTPEQLCAYSQTVRGTLREWNESRTNKFDWQPKESELAKLFCSGSRKHKLAICYQAYNLNNNRINYPELVLRAVRLMLRSSEKKRIQNPTGWLWSCLHGNGDGTTPWVQLLTVDEENSVGNHLKNITAPRSRHPP